MKRLGDIFNIRYGNQFDLNKMDIVGMNNDPVSFVSRTSKNNGVVAMVNLVNGCQPFASGDITVALGGSVLSSFVQPRRFYTGQNVAVLSNDGLSVKEKLFYCMAIKKNAYRYQACGREANKTLPELLVPDVDDIPSWINDINILSKDDVSMPKLRKEMHIDTAKWKKFRYEELFIIGRGLGPRKNALTDIGENPFISASELNNGLTGWTDHKAMHKANVISVVRNGNSVASAFYQDKPFCSTEDVHIFTPRFKLNKFIALFLCTLIKKEKYRFNYGRKWGIARMNESIIKLPVTDTGEPDWEFMENYIKSLPYSSNLSDDEA